MAGLHEGHRQRLKNRFLKEGLDSFEPHNVLELLLFYAIPQKDTNDLAHALLNHFGSFCAVLDASYEELITVPGIGPNVATLLKLVPALSRYYLDDRDGQASVLKDLDEIGDFLFPKFVGRTKEMVYLLCLNGSGKILYSNFVFEGSVNSVQIYTAEIVAAAARVQAASIVLAHNHPGALAIPSQKDIAATQAISHALYPLGVTLLDHFVFAGNDYVSMRVSGYLGDGQGR